MICPACATQTLQPTLLENDLPALRCSNCSGIFISSNEYRSWLQTHRQEPSEAPSEQANIHSVEAGHAKICPECRHILFRYKIWPLVDFYLDRCGNCNGVWFDKNEWDVLSTRNAQGQINQFFTKPWQTQLRQAETKKLLDKIYVEKFGADDYARAKEIRAWLDQNPQRAMLLAYLESKDPYKL